MNPNITGKNYEGTLCTLLDSMGMPVKQGQVVTDEYGDTWTVTGGAAPHNANATGFVFVDHVEEGYSRNFYVGVLKMRWAE